MDRLSISAAELCKAVGGQIANQADFSGNAEAVVAQRPSGLEDSKPGDLAFFFSKEYIEELKKASPSILVTGLPFVEPLKASGLPLWKKAVIIACKDPYYAMAILSEKFAALSTVSHVRRGEKSTIHPSSVIHSSAELGEGVEIRAHVVVEDGAKIGARTVIYPGCFIGSKVEIGEDCVLFPNVTVYEWTKIGNRVRLHSGVVIGADGFGYAPQFIDGKPVGHTKIYHFGRVVIGDDVEMGALSSVDRATFGETIIGKQVKIDNHAQVGHNAVVDEGTIVCGFVGICGSGEVGKYVYIGGLTGVGPRTPIGDGAKLGAGSIISKAVGPGELAVGNPQRSYRMHFKAHATLDRMVGGRHVATSDKKKLRSRHLPGHLQDDSQNKES